MWQFDKALYPNLYGQDDVCANTSNNIKNMHFVSFTVAT